MMVSDAVLNAGLYPTTYLACDTHVRKLVIENLHHAFVGGQIPYLPTSAELQTAEHPEYLAHELFRRFLLFTETVAALDPRDVVCLYFFNRPHRSERYPHLEAGLIIKSARADESQAQHAVEQLWALVRHAFPTESPFGYPLALASQDDVKLWQTELKSGCVKTTATFHKYSDGGTSQLPKDAFPHPYRNTPSLHALSPLLAAMKASPAPLLLAISLRANSLVDPAHASKLLQDLSGVLAGGGEIRQRQSESAVRRGAKFQNTTFDFGERIQRKLDIDRMQPESERLRAELGARVLEELWRRRDQLLSMTVTLASWDNELPSSVAQAVRVTLSGNAASAFEGGALYCMPPDIVIASAEQNPDVFNQALNDLRWLEQDITTHRAPADQWKHLVTPEEAVALFTLPMPSEFGQVPGMVARSQPFHLPVELADDPAAEEKRPGLIMGRIWDGGLQTEEELKIPLDKLDQHILIAGRTGSGKTNTCLQLLCEMGRQDIPFLILDPLDKRDYRLLLGEPKLRDRLRIYTPGDQTSPLVFNPFIIPPEVTVQRHISQLLRCFLTAFVTVDPLPAIYRAALRRVYAMHGWHNETRGGQPGLHAPTFLEFFQTLELVAEERSREYSKDIQGNIRQMTRLRIGSLLEDNAAILNVAQNDQRDALDVLVKYPTVIELGHIGSDEDKALIMTFLLACLLPRIQFRTEREPTHVIVIEEAHRLMRRGSNTNELRGDATNQTRSDFSNLLAEVRGYNQGIVVVDQSPAELVASVFSNTATHIMHHLRDPQSFEMMASTFVLSTAQIAYMHRLEPHHAITETARGMPVHIKPDNVTAQLKESLRAQTDIAYFDSNRQDTFVLDHAVVSVMANRLLDMPTTSPISDFETLLTGSCDGCRLPFHKRKCEHWLRVRVALKSVNGQKAFRKIDQVCAMTDVAELREKIDTLLEEFVRITSATADKKNEVMYCALAQWAEALKKGTQEQGRRADKYLELLNKFVVSPKEK